MKNLRRLGIVLLAGLLLLFCVRRYVSDARRLEAAKRRVVDECRAYRSQPQHASSDVCRYDEFSPGVVPALTKANAQVEVARAAFARHDPKTANGALIFAAGYADSAKWSGTLIGRLVHKRVLEQILDLVEQHFPDIDVWSVMPFLAGAIAADATPLESTRLHNAWSLVQANERSPFWRLQASDAATGRELEQDDAAFREMDQRVLAHDADGCAKARDGLGPVALEWATPALCQKMVDVVTQRERAKRVFDELSARGLPTSRRVP